MFTENFSAMPDSDNIVFWAVLLLAILAFMVGPFASSGFRANMYTIKVNHCDQTLYENATKWYTGDWSVVPGIGVCPNGRVKFEKRRRRNRSNSRKTKRYRDCINFQHDKSDWKHIDRGNKALGYESNLEGGAKTWSKARQCYVAGIVFAFIILGLGGAGASDNDSAVIGIGVLLIPLSFILFVVVLAITANTDQLDEKSWSTYYFQTCHVNIIPDVGYRYLVTATVLSGIITFVLICTLFIVMVSMCDCKSCCNQTVPSSQSPADVEMEPVVAEAEIAAVNVPVANVEFIRQAIKDTRIQLARQLSSNSSRFSSQSDSGRGDTLYAHQVDINVSADATAQPVAEVETLPPGLRDR
jgi:hypothetical protein